MPSHLSDQQLPGFLQSFENFQSHLEEHFGDLGSSQRGDTFLNLALKVLPLSDGGMSFSAFEANEKKSHDQGVDIISGVNESGEILFCQSKYKIRKKDELDSIISKFYDFERNYPYKDKQPGLFGESNESPSLIFIVITSSKISRIIDVYMKSELSSRSYYDKLISEHRLHIIDGVEILSLLQYHYKRANLIPNSFQLRSKFGWLSTQNVHLGILLGSDLKALYDQFGEGLFFENIRDFLGVGRGRKAEQREDVNT